MGNRSGFSCRLSISHINVVGLASRDVRFTDSGWQEGAIKLGIWLTYMEKTNFSQDPRLVRVQFVARCLALIVCEVD